jgi:hypothetical protein
MESINLYKPDAGAELFVTKSSWFYRSYTLTDDLNVYGQLTYSGFWQSVGLVEAANQSWTIERAGLFTRDVLINEVPGGETVAVLKTSARRGVVTLEFADGQVFRFIRKSFFSPVQLWYSEQYGDILSITSKFFSYKRPFIIGPRHNVLKNSNYLVLLTFISIHLILIRRAGKAAIAN